MATIELDSQVIAAAQAEADRRGVDVSVAAGEAQRRFVAGSDLPRLLDEFDTQDRARLDTPSEMRRRRRSRRTTCRRQWARHGWLLIRTCWCRQQSRVVPPRQVVELAANGSYVMVVCPHLVGELTAVPGRDRFLRWRTREQLDRFVADIVALADHTADPDTVAAVTRDPNDDYLVALAVNSAAVMCTGALDLHEPGRKLRS